MEEQKKNIVGIRFVKIGKMYHFEKGKVDDLTVGDKVVVETSRGLQIGEVAQFIEKSVEPSEGPLRPLIRRATPRDLAQRQIYQQKEDEVVEYSRKRIRELGIQEVKIVTTEISFDGNRCSVLFCTEREDKVEFKSLKQDIHKQLNVPSVELKQVGPRDVAKCLGGMGACGIEKRCCSRFLTEFNSISIRMAKEQGISLTPTEITGMCGRLRCCLVYEYDFYVKTRQALPKRNSHVTTPLGVGKVMDINPLKSSVFVELPEIGIREFTKEEVEPAMDPGAPPQVSPEFKKETPAENRSPGTESFTKSNPNNNRRSGNRPNRK
jgi:cell fate regulator YaaT (PSP1 superfamily)